MSVFPRYPTSEMQNLLLSAQAGAHCSQFNEACSRNEILHILLEAVSIVVLALKQRSLCLYVSICSFFTASTV